MGRIDNFIFNKPCALNEDICEDVISEFESYQATCNSEQFVFEYNGGGPITSRKDLAYWMPQHFQKQYKEVRQTLFDSLLEYGSVMESMAGITLHSETCKVQKTPVGGGFHQWHIEQGSPASRGRVLAWMIYLNDVDVGGETEFIYQQMKFKAERGMLLIWPAGITHPHRGNPPYSNEKYVITGWFEIPHEATQFD